MSTIRRPFLGTLAGLFRSRAVLHMEVLALRQQLAMVTERNYKRLRFHRRDRFFWVLLYRVWPGCLQGTVNLSGIRPLFYLEELFQRPTNKALRP